MIDISSESDIDTCRKLWQDMMPSEQFTDLWDVRMCFGEQYKRKLMFVVARQNDKPVGLIPLCFIQEDNYWGYFPGEVWQSKTWIEQNRIIAPDQNVADKMFEWLDQNNINYSLRYLHKHSFSSDNDMPEDEIGYLFHPPAFNFNMDEYYSLFSRKPLKTIQKDVNKYYAQNLTFRLDDPEDFDIMVELNIERFGTQSYFASNPFVRSFKALRDYLKNNDYLKMTTVLIDKKIAAVDLGCLYKGNYTLIAGATNAEFPGIAKLINLWHMNTACVNGYQTVDFLCGDFCWKKLFHLTPRPLYKLTNIEEQKNSHEIPSDSDHEVCV